MNDKFNPVVFRITRLTRRMSLVEQELPTLPEHLSSPPIFSGVRVTRSLFLFLYKKNREHNGQKKKDKRINNNLQNIKQKS
jgi:hypothetical protein